MKSAENLILIDGDCNLCNRLVRFLAKRDPHRKFSFATLESSPYQNLKSVVFIGNNQAHIKSDAILKIFHTLGGAWRMLTFLGRIVPRKWRNALYDFIADNRYAWFGQRNACEMPSDTILKTRFVDTREIIFPPAESHFQSY